jgi:ribosomal protein S18 acetylase RimI-like enzyme
MVITVPAHRPAANGARPINLNKDIPQVLQLLQIAFGEALDEDGRRVLQMYTAPVGQPAFLWRFNPAANRLSQGYVWEENGRIVGNATLLSTQTNGRYLIVNVAVHPDCRRRGIARRLMNAVADHVHQHHGHEILLQVDKDNTSAINLYRSLNYVELGTMTNWSATAGRVYALEDNGQPVPVRELQRREWQQAYQLDCLALAADLNWPEHIPTDAYRQGLWQQLSGLVNGRAAETWVVNEGQQLIGMASIWSEWGRAHRLTLRVHPQWTGQLERPLLAKILRRLSYLPRRRSRIDHPDDDQFTNNLLRQANFKPQRSLTHMRLNLG